MDPKSQRTVLIVEDESTVRMLLRRMLERDGHRVLEATSADAGLEVWRTRAAEVDLVVSDIVMPGKLHAFELAAQIRADRPDVRVIFSSGYSVSLGDPRANLKSGENFIAKPYTMSAMIAIVRRALGLPLTSE